MDRRPYGWIRHAAPELTYQSCLHIGQLIATYNEKDISIDRPILSAALPDGERVQVIIPPACLANTVSMTIRKPSMTDKTLDELEGSGAFAEVDDASDGLRPFEIELLELKKKRQIKEFLHKVVLTKRQFAYCGKNGFRQNNTDSQPYSLHPKD